MEVIGFILGIFIGISLGLIGSGGSILTIPVLVYLMHIVPSTATAYSLFIVGVSALVGSIKGAKQKLVDNRIAIYFGIPSVFSIFLMRKYLVPMLPDVFFEIQGYAFKKDFVIMLVFAILMMIASISMISNRKLETTDEAQLSLPSIISLGLAIGALTGFVGVGGGFLIIPTLVYKARIPMRNAVATSLAIISLNSLIGFGGSIGNLTIHWLFLLTFTGFAVVGIFTGIYLSRKISSQQLKPAFGWFVLLTGIYILIKEILLK